MAKKKKICVEFNTSENPFAYIRSEKDIDVFIENIKNAGEELEREAAVSRDAIRLIYILSYYLLEECHEEDRSIDNLLKLLNKTCTKASARNEKTIFDIMFESCTNESLKAKYDFFKREVFGTYSDLYQTIVQECLDLLTTIPVGKLIVGMPDDKFPQQAIFLDQMKKYEVWFHFTDSFEVCKYHTVNKNYRFLVLHIPKFSFDPANDQLLNFFYFHSSVDFKGFLTSKADEFLKLVQSPPARFCSINNTKPAASADDSKKPLFGELTNTHGREYNDWLYYERSCAIHESGHAVAAYLLNAKLYGVSIVPNTLHAGNIKLLNEEKLYLECDAMITYAGEVAENILFSNILTYPYTDLERVVRKVKEKVLSEQDLYEAEHKFKFLPAYELGLKDRECPYVIYHTMHRCLEYYNKTVELIESNKNLVQALSEELIRKKSMTGKEIEEFLDQLWFVHSVEEEIPSN